MKISIDTNILIWGVRQVSDAGQEEMIPRATAFLEWIDRQGHELVLTTQVVAEYLVGGTEKKRNSQYEVLAAEFKIYPLDDLAARIAAGVRSDKDFVKAMKRDGKTRACINADIAIVATAKAHSVDVFYPNDNDLRNAVKRCGLLANDLPTTAQLSPITQEMVDDKPKRSHERLLLPPEDAE